MPENEKKNRRGFKMAHSAKRVQRESRKGGYENNFAADRETAKERELERHEAAQTAREKMIRRQQNRNPASEGKPSETSRIPLWNICR